GGTRRQRRMSEVKVGSKKADRSAKKSAAIASKKAPSQEKQKAKASSKRSASAAALAPEPQRDDDDDDEPVSSAKATKSNGRAKDQLISLGKSKGFLTYDDVHEALPGEDVGPDQMDDVLSAL